MEEMGIEDARLKLGDIVIAAAERGEHTVITRYGKPAAVIVPVEWLVEARADLAAKEDAE